MKVVVGIDSGGSNTRALAVTLDGKRVGYAETGGGNSAHDSESCENVREAVRQATASCGIENVVRLVAGVAGFDHPEHAVRVAEFTEVEGLVAPRTHLNDTEVANFSAHQGGPGIVSIQGTGSLILAILENGRRVKDGDFSHYAPSAAVRLGMRAVVKLLTTDDAADDPSFVAGTLTAWGVDSLAELREVQSRVRALKPQEFSARFGAVARLLTTSAEAKSVFANQVCDAAARDIVNGIRLLGPLFESNEVPVALIGSCVNSVPIRRKVLAGLAEAKDRNYRIVEPKVSPVVGAVLMALKEEGITAVEVEEVPSIGLAPQ